MPSPLHPPTGCRFHTRCPAMRVHPEIADRCKSETPVLQDVGGEYYVACHLYDDVNCNA